MSARRTYAIASEPEATDRDGGKAAVGPLHILVNNAGMTRDMLALRMSDQDWQAVLDVDLSAPFRLARGALRGMVRRRAGRIINISSIVGATGNAGQANYAAAKAGLVGMSKALAQEVASRGMTINVVAPGFVVTAMTDVLARGAAGQAGGSRSRYVGWDSPKTSPAPWSIWRRTKPGGSPAPHCT